MGHERGRLVWGGAGPGRRRALSWTRWVGGPDRHHHDRRPRAGGGSRPRPPIDQALQVRIGGTLHTRAFADASSIKGGASGPAASGGGWAWQGACNIGRAWVSWASIGLSPTTAALKRTCNCCQRRPPIPGPPDRSLPDGGFRRPCRLGPARAWRQMERLSAFWPRSLPGRSVPRAYQQQTMGTPNDSQLGNVPVGILSAPSFALVLLAVRRVDAGGARCILASLG